MTKIIYILLWWPSWYLLFFMHGTQGKLQWVVTEKVSSYGQSLTLFCSVNDCCNEKAGWNIESKAIFIDIKEYTDVDPNLEYGGTYNESGFGLIIRNLSETDVNKTYTCIYGFEISARQYLRQENVFIKGVPDKDKDEDEENNTVTILSIGGAIVGTCILVGCLITAYCVYRSHKNGNKPNHVTGNNSPSRPEEVPLIVADSPSRPEEVPLIVAVPVIELKKNMFTVYESEEVLIECNEIRNNKNDGQPYWERIDENGESCILTIREDKEGKYGLERYPPCLKILNVQMSDRGYYRCCIVYSASKTVRSEKANLIIEKIPVIELKQNTLTVYEREEVLIECSEITKNKNDGQPYWERFGGNGESCNLTIREDKEGKYGLKRDPPCLKILNVQMSDSGDYYCCIEYSTSDGKKTARSQKAHLIIKKNLKEDTEKERTERLLAMLKTFTAKSSTTEVILCHREVKYAIIKAGKELKKQIETFIIVNKFYYNDRFLEQNSINISQGNEAVT